MGGAGYHVRVQLLNAAALVPQHRERLFLVGLRHDLADAAARFEWPSFSPRQSTLRDIIETVGEAELPKYQLTAAQWAQVQASHEWQRQPGWRLAQLDGSARTLRGSYRKSYGRRASQRSCLPNDEH